MELLRGAGNRYQFSIEFHGSESMMQLINPFSLTPVQNVTGKCVYELYRLRNYKDMQILIFHLLNFRGIIPRFLAVKLN